MKPRILVIRGGAIGDFILTLPAIGLLRQNFPDAHLEILGYKHIIELAEKRYYADATRCIEYAALSGFFVPNSDLAPDLVEYFASFQQIVSYLYDPDKLFESNVRRCGVKHFLHAPPKVEGSLHAAQHLAAPLQSIALFLEDSAARLHPTPEDRAFAAEFLGETSAPLIALHPGSGSERKNWPLMHWREFGDWLFSLPSRPTVLLIGGEADEQNLSALNEAWRGQPVRIVRNLRLAHLAAVVERSVLFVGHDSGISHLAAAVGVECVLLFGATDPAIWAPANSNVKVIEAASGLLKDVSPSEVKQTVVTLLSEDP